ncbi:uncharacterized protein V1510DRAFT_408845 [Dipodascopsis tothii]|uniref:uncharacterized protein n=1 Tax=Dipodascopsis tothii TaxID=44089 RepID=UPI0034CE5461
MGVPGMSLTTSLGMSLPSIHKLPTPPMTPRGHRDLGHSPPRTFHHAAHEGKPKTKASGGRHSRVDRAILLPREDVAKLGPYPHHMATLGPEMQILFRRIENPSEHWTYRELQKSIQLPPENDPYMHLVQVYDIELTPYRPGEDAVVVNFLRGKGISEGTIAAIKDGASGKIVPHLDITISALLHMIQRNGEERVKRPLNPYMLFRKGLVDFMVKRSVEMAAEVNHRHVSTISKVLWARESETIKIMFKQLFVEDRELHRLVHPTYRYAPRRANRKKL